MRNFAGWISLLALMLIAPLTAGAGAKAARPYVVSASAGSGGSVAPKGKITVAAGSEQGFSVVPNAGYHLVDVKLDGVSKGAVMSVKAPTDFADNKTNSHKLAATFAVNTYRVNVQAGSGGKVSLASKTVKYGTKLSFTVTPSKGYTISSMSAGDPGTTGTAPAGSYSKGVFKGALTVTSNIDLSVSFVQETSGGGSTGFTSTMLSGKSVCPVGPGGYRMFTFNSKGTVKGSSVVTSGMPVQNITASWKLFPGGSLTIFSGGSWSYTYTLAADSGTYWEVVETDGAGVSSSARIYYGSGALAAAEAYYLAEYGGGNSDGGYFYGYALGAGESAAANLTISAFTGKKFYWSNRSSGSYGEYVFDAGGSTSGTGKSTSLSPAGASNVFEWSATSLSNSYNDQNTVLNIAFVGAPHIVLAKSSTTYYYVCTSVDLYTGQQPPVGCSRWYFDNNGAGKGLAKMYAGK